MASIRGASQATQARRAVAPHHHGAGAGVARGDALQRVADDTLEGRAGQDVAVDRRQPGERVELRLDARGHVVEGLGEHRSISSSRRISTRALPARRRRRGGASRA